VENRKSKIAYRKDGAGEKEKIHSKKSCLQSPIPTPSAPPSQGKDSHKLTKKMEINNPSAIFRRRGSANDCC
jgi:hypothetical protein